jgi:hypothetical protein
MAIETAPRRFGWLEPLLLACLLAAGFAARWPFRQAELFRDEGEYVHLGQEILRGNVPYRDVYNQKTPLTFYWMAGVQKVAGTSLAAVRVFTALYGLVTTVAVYLLMRRLFGRSAALWAVLAFSIMTFDQCGTEAPTSTEMFMLLWVVVAVDLWYRARDRQRAWMTVLAGMAAGLAYQTKQTGLAVLVFFIGERLLSWWREGWRVPRAWLAAARDAALATAGFAIVMFAVLAYFAAHGALGDYWQCTWTNNWPYVNARSDLVQNPYEFLRMLVETVARWDLVLWVFGTAGLIGLGLRGAGARGRDLWLLLLLLLAAALKAGRGYSQYYEPLMVPLSFGSGVAAAWLVGQARAPSAPILRRVAASVLLVVPWVWPAAHIGSLLTMSENERVALCRAEPFSSAADAGRYLAKQTAPNEPVLVLGSEPEIYYYAERPAACRMAIMYPMTGPYSYSPALQDEFFRQWDDREPQYVAIMTPFDSFSEWPEQGTAFVNRVLTALRAHYTPVASFPPQRNAPGHADASQPYVWVFRRAPAGK